MSSKQIRSGAKAPGHRRHIVGRLMGYIKRGYKARFIIVLVCILVSAIANVAGSLFLGSLIDDYITPLLGAAVPGRTENHSGRPVRPHADPAYQVF